MKLLVPVGLFLGGIAGGALADSSGYVRTEPREWKDEAGRPRKRVDAQGRMTLFTYDEAGRVVRIAGSAALADRAGGVIWEHLFLYDERGLTGEIDCVGRRHEVSQAQPLDLGRGTALGEHRHVRVHGREPSFPLPETERLTLRHEFDHRGRLTSVEDD